MSIVEFLSQPIWQRLGLTLVHFLWQGLAVAVLVGAFVRVFRLNHGNARYGAYLLAFAAMIVCPVVTFTAIDISISPNTELVTEAESTEVIDSSSYTALSEGDILPEAEIAGSAIPALANSIPLSQRISDWLNVSMPWVLVIWMVGVVVLSVRLLMGYVGVYRWRHNLEPLPERLALRVASLSDGLGMRGFSRVFISPTVLQAMAVGYLRPMILLPAAMVTQMQPEMLEAVIAHELAHICRFDLWINLAQRVTETLLFYHPAVWWLSNCLRSERELCCDELAVKATGKRITYASTLESVGRFGFMAKQPVLAAGLGQGNKPTLHRVRHILGLTPAQRNCPFWLAGVIAVMFLAAIVIPTTLALTNQSDENLMDYESLVLEGIGANRDKFECGYLAWSRMYVNPRYEDPRGKQSGQYELWWNGKKMATKYLQDQVYNDPEGHYSVKKQQGGVSYDGSRFSRKPRFEGPENWLSLSRWRGEGSSDWRILNLNNTEYFAKDWSVVDTNGIKLIKLTTTYTNETDTTNSGGYAVEYYDPSKGYGLVKGEGYNPDGSPRVKHTVKILEVIPGGWFPVEVDTKSFARTDGKVYGHSHYALDIERCSFNDKSALPDRIFKGAIDKQLKYQEKLEKYLAMELEGLSRVKEIDETDKVKRGAREAIEIFITAAMAGDLEQAGQYAHPARMPARQIADIPETLKGQNLWIMAVLADDSSAIAVSSVIRGDHDRIGPLVFLLDREPQDGRDNWWVHDIDMETPDGAEGELKQFLEKHPEAQKVPYENKPAVQVEGGKEALTAEKLVLKLVDTSGKPVAGAKAGTNVRTRDEQVLNSKLSWSFYSKGENVSDKDGKIVLIRDKLFPQPWATGRKRALYIFNEERQIGAFCEISKDEQRHEIELTLEPVCHVHGKLSSEDLEEIGRPLKWSNVYLNFNKDSHGVLSCMSKKQQFDFWVPPGEYELNAYGSGAGASTKYVQPIIEIKTGQSELDLGVVDLPATKLATLIGKPAPQIGPIKAWKNGSPITLTDLIGKAVIIYFDGTSPNTSRDLPPLVDLHNQFEAKGLVIIALYNCPSMEALEAKWVEVYKKYGGVQNVPFRVAVDGGKSTFYEGTDIERLGATYGRYDIEADPTTILIDPDGKIVGELNLSEAREVLEKMLAVKPQVSGWRQVFDEVYRLEDNQILKQIAPPFIPERRDYYVNEHSSQASAISRSPGKFIFHWDGTLKNWGLGFVNKSNLSSILYGVLRLKSFEYNVPEKLLNIELSGDWIIRDEVSQETKLRALEELIAEELNRTIQFEKRTVERQVIVAAGHFKFYPPSETYENKSVHLYADKLDPDEGSGGGTADSVNDFLLRLGSIVDMPVVDHTEPSKGTKIPYRHHRSSYLRRIKDNAEKSSKLDTLLINLTRQTELQFRIERRPAEVWFVTEQKKTNKQITVSK